MSYKRRYKDLQNQNCSSKMIQKHALKNLFLDFRSWLRLGTSGHLAESNTRPKFPGREKSQQNIWGNSFNSSKCLLDHNLKKSKRQLLPKILQLIQFMSNHIDIMGFSYVCCCRRISQALVLELVWVCLPPRERCPWIGCSLHFPPHRPKAC